MLKSVFEITYNDRFQCAKCIKKTKEEYRERVFGCTGKSPYKLDGGKFTYTKCPGNFYNSGYDHLFDAHRMFRKGVMGSHEGYLDQSSKYIEAMNYIESLTIQRESDLIPKPSKQVKKNGR